MSKAPQDIIKAPVITEKSVNEISDGKYTFKVAVDAKKPEIASAVEQLFGVKVIGVNTANFDGKLKRQRYQLGRTPAYKKALLRCLLSKDRIVSDCHLSNCRRSRIKCFYCHFYSLLI